MHFREQSSVRCPLQNIFSQSGTCLLILWTVSLTGQTFIILIKCSLSIMRFMMLTEKKYQLGVHHQKRTYSAKRKGFHPVHADTASHAPTVACVPGWAVFAEQKRRLKEGEIRARELHYKHRVLPAGHSCAGFSRLSGVREFL